MSYRDNVIDLMDKQIEKGVSKYGTKLEENKWLKDIERLTYLQEELVDALLYIEHIKAILKDK